MIVLYRITDRETGREITQQEKPYYVHIGSNGCWQACTRSEALAISNHGQLYKLDFVEYDGDLPEGNWMYNEPGNPASGVPVVMVSERATGDITHDLHNAKKTHAEQIADLEESAAAQTIESTARLDDIEQVLGELLVRGVD